MWLFFLFAATVVMNLLLGATEGEKAAVKRKVRRRVRK